MQSRFHHPQISMCADGWRVVECLECQQAGDIAVRIGIGMPLPSQHVAEMLRENHLRRGAVA